MSIQMRKGYYDDFDPTKMTPGEWAVSIDEDSNKQIVWMCFAPGVVKRMGTVEDFDVEIQRLIHNQMESINTSVSNANQSEVNAKISEDNAKMYAESASTSALNAKISETNAKTSEEECKKALESVPKDITTITNQVNQNKANIESLQSNKADKATTLAGYGITDAQEKLTNPLTQSDVVDNLSSTSTNKPLSANQGRVLSSNVNARFYNAVSDLWNDTTTYEVGQYCIFSNTLWKCLIRNSGQTPQEGTYWTQTSVDNEITELNSNLNDVNNIALSGLIYRGVADNLVYGCYGHGIYSVPSDAVGHPLPGYDGYMITLHVSNSIHTKILFLSNTWCYIMNNNTDGTPIQEFMRFSPN